MSQLFVIQYTPGPTWDPEKPVFEQNLRAHGGYMKQLYDAGQLTHGGPFTDNSGGLSIIRADDLEAAQAILAADPAIIDGVFVATLHPWLSVDWNSYQS